MDNVTELYSNLRVYTPTIYYVDTRQYDECVGRCEEIENKESADKWVIIRCLYCHADKLPCLGKTQDGRGCRRTTNLSEEGLCPQHDGKRD